MECVFFGVAGGLIANGCIYMYNIATRKRISNKEVVNATIAAIKKNGTSMRDIIKGVR